MRYKKHPTATANSMRLTTFCPLYVTGRPVMNSCSFPNAMKLPVTVSEPKSTSKPSAVILARGIPSGASPSLTPW
jgi:hypothetical protein